MTDWIVGIDPGNKQSAFCITDCALNPVRFGKTDNELMYMNLCDAFAELNCLPNNTTIAIEWVKSYGNPVGDSIFETCAWVGKLEERLKEYETHRVIRANEKSVICHSMKANDARIKQALINEFAKDTPNHGKGTKKQPGFFYGFRADIWQSFAVAYTIAKNLGVY